MDIIRIDSDAFEQIMDKLVSLEERFVDLENRAEIKLSERWLNSEEVAELLSVSMRTLQEIRGRAELPFSQVGKKMYYKATDVESYLERNYQSLPNFKP